MKKDLAFIAEPYTSSELLPTDLWDSLVLEVLVGSTGETISDEARAAVKWVTSDT